MATKPAPTVEYVSLSQAAKDLGVSASSVSYYVKQGTLATVEVAGHRAIERTVLDAYTAVRAATVTLPHLAVRRAVERDKALTGEQREAIIKVLDA